MATRSVSNVVTGVCPVIEVPFHPDGAVDTDGFGTVLDRVLAAGVSSMMFPGFASEFHKLSEQERTELSSELVRRCRRFGVTPVISIGDHGTVPAVARAVAAVEAGAGALNLLPPHTVPVGAEALRRHLRTVLDAVAPTPVIVQYAPHQTGTALDAAALDRLRQDAPNLAAVKVESTPPGAMVSALSALSPPLPPLIGYAGLQLLDAHRRGAVGVQPGCSFVELYQRVWSDLDGGRQASATALHRRMVPYLAAWMQSVEIVVAVEKEISRRRGWIASAHCREPAHRLDPIEQELIEDFLTEFAAELGR